MWFALVVNVLSAVLSVVAIALYAVGYTILLKRRTSQNIVWGGIAGCMPTLIGWSAVTGTVGWPAVVLFLVIFFWTPPHYWPLSMAFRDDYSAAGRADAARRAGAGRRRPPDRRLLLGHGRRLARCSCRSRRWAGCTPSPRCVAGAVCSSSRRTACCGLPAPASPGLALKPMRLFHYSITYVTLVFLAVAVDPLLHLPIG